MKNENRKQHEQVINEAKAYFEFCGLTASFEGLFAKDMVKNLIHEKNAEFEKDVNDMVQEITELKMPEPIMERVKSVAEAATGKEEEYLNDVKISLMLSLKNLFDALETVLVVDDNVAAAFKLAFESNDPESKIMKILKEICEGINGKKMEKVAMLMCVPEGIPDDLMGLLMLLGGGMPMMNLSEMMDMFGADDDDEEDDENIDED